MMNYNNNKHRFCTQTTECPKKSWHFWIFCQIKNVKHFREIYVWMAEGLIYHMTPKYLKIINARVSTGHFCKGYEN